MSSRGQALVEFAAVLLPVLLLIVGIIQFGLLFGANVTALSSLPPPKVSSVWPEVA